MHFLLRVFKEVDEHATWEAHVVHKNRKVELSKVLIVDALERVVVVILCEVELHGAGLNFLASLLGFLLDFFRACVKL